MKFFYLKLTLFCIYILLQNVVVAEDKITLTDLIGSNGNETGLNSTGLNSTAPFNNSTPVIFNCTNGIPENATDLSKCTPINITLSFECTKVNYDFLIYSATWQPKLCHEKRCSGSRSYESPKWRIQGLRGSFLNGTRPIQCCSDRQLKIQELGPIYSELKDKWVYEQDANVTDSLVEDWNLHGSCVQQYEDKSSLQLYSKALDISRKLPFELWLSNAKIEPSNEKKYGLQFFNYTISSKLGKMYQMRCKTVDYEKRISVIDTINVCVDRASSEIIDCPADFESNCLEMIYYPTHLLENKIPDEVVYRDMNYYRYANYHHSYSPMYSSRSFLTGAAIGAIPAATLALPAAYYFFKNKNKYNRNKYATGYPGAYGSGGMPWYSSQQFANSFAPSPAAYGGHNFNNLGGGNNLYPRQASPNYYPPSIYSTSGRGFGNLNAPDLSPGFYNSRPNSGAYPSHNYPSYPSSGSGSYPAYPPPKYSANAPSYPSYSNTAGSGYPISPGSHQGSSVGSYPNAGAYPNTGNYPKSAGSSLPAAPPPYSVSGNQYPKQAGPGFDKPPSYSAANSGKYSPSAPSLSDMGSSSRSNKPAPTPYKPSAKPKSSGGIFGGIFGSGSGGKAKSGGSYGGRSGGFGGRRGGGMGRARG